MKTFPIFLRFLEFLHYSILTFHNSVLLGANIPASKQSQATIFPQHLFNEIFETYRNVERILSNHIPTT